MDPFYSWIPRKCLPVRLLEASAGTTTTELLGFAAAGVSDKERAVELHQRLLDLPLRGLVNVLLVEGNDGLCNGLTHSCTTKKKSVQHNQILCTRVRGALAVRQFSTPASTCIPAHSDHIGPTLPSRTRRASLWYVSFDIVYPMGKLYVHIQAGADVYYLQEAAVLPAT